MNKMTAKQQRFCQNYLIDFNGTQAAIRAGYSKKTAGYIGWQLLQKTLIQKEIQKNQQKIAEKIDVSVEKIVQEYVKIGFTDMRDYVEWGPRKFNLKVSSELTSEQAAAVSEVSIVKSRDGGSVKIKLHDKKGALDSLGKHLGMFHENHGETEEPVTTVKIVVEDARVTK